MRRSLLLSVLAMILIAGCKSNNTVPANEVATVDGKNDAATTANENAYTGPKRYPIKSGIIQYQMISPQTGTLTVFFDNYGMKEARYYELLSIDKKQNSMDLQILDGDTLYIIKLNEKKGSKQLRPPFLFQVFTDSLMLADGYMNTGKETIGGKECSVWTKKKIGSTTWTWQGMILKQETTTGDRTTYSVTSIREDVPVSAGKFAIPEGIALEEAPPVPKTKGK